MKTILLEALGINRFGGTRTSLLNLFSHMFTLDQERRYLVLLSAAEPTLDPFPNVAQIVIPTANRFTVRLDLQRRLPGLIRREGVDLVHFTKNLGAFGLPCPYIVTVHDLTSLLLKNSLADVAYYRLIEPLTLRGAAGLVAVSHDAARDVERFYGIPQRDIEVVYWAPDDRFNPDRNPDRIEAVRRRYNLPQRYILFIGILAKKKNLPTLLRALAQVRTGLPDAPDLVVAGRPYPQSSDTESVPLVRRLNLDGHVHFIGGVAHEDVPLLYAGAEMYILPSVHEGFGIPLLEAMACGIPVITSGGGSLPEVAGDAALIVTDPMDVAGFAAAIERVLGEASLRDGMIRRGTARAAEFSWDRSARKMLSIYETVLGKAGR